MILVDAVGQFLRRLPTGVSAAEGHRGGVLVDLRAFQPKGLDGAQGLVEEDVLVAAVVETLQGLADAVVMNAADLRRLQSQAVFVQRGQPVGDGVHRHGGGQDIVDEQAERSLNGQLDPLVLRDIGGDHFPDPEFLEIVLDDGMGAQDELAEKGALAPTGPSDHGGRGASAPGAGRAFLWLDRFMGLDTRIICGIITADQTLCQDPGSKKPMPSASETKLAKLRRDYEAAKAQIQALGYVIPGTVQRRLYSCGKSNCRCVTQGILHGPYYQWTRKVSGKTVNINLDVESAKKVKEWIQNDRDLRQLCRRLERTSLAVLQTSTSMCKT